MCDETIEIGLDEIEVLDDYNPLNEISKVPDFDSPLVQQTEIYLNEAKSILYSLPSFVETIKSLVPKKVFEAVLSSEDSAKLAAGLVEIMPKKNGSFLAMLRDPVTKKFIKQVPI